MKSVALALIRFYRICLSPLLPSFCRYYPTCSVYAYEAIERYGAWRGTGMALRRVLSCRPGGGFGYDPVPEEEGLGIQDSGFRIGTDREGERRINRSCFGEEKAPLNARVGHSLLTPES